MGSAPGSSRAAVPAAQAAIPSRAVVKNSRKEIVSPLQNATGGPGAPGSVESDKREMLRLQRSMREVERIAAGIHRVGRSLARRTKEAAENIPYEEKAEKGARKAEELGRARRAKEAARAKAVEEEAEFRQKEIAEAVAASLGVSGKNRTGARVIPQLPSTGAEAAVVTAAALTLSRAAKAMGPDSAAGELKDLAQEVSRKGALEDAQLLAAFDSKLRTETQAEADEETEEEDACSAAKAKAMDELVSAKRQRRDARFAVRASEAKIELVAKLRKDLQYELEKITAAEQTAAELGNIQEKYGDLVSAAEESMDDLNSPAVEVDLYLGGENAAGEVRRLPKKFSEIRNALETMKTEAETEEAGGSGEKLTQMTSETLPGLSTKLAEKDSTLEKEEEQTKTSLEKSKELFESNQQAEKEAEEALATAEKDCKAKKSLLTKKTQRRKVEADAVEVAIQLLHNKGYA